jgi:hypothetical protein
MITNINPKIWGKNYWDFLHMYISTYPEIPTESEKNTFYLVISGIFATLPCEKCRSDTANQLKIFQLNAKTLENNKNLTLWINNIHKSINDKIKREIQINQGIQINQNYNTTQNNVKIYNVMLIFLIVIILIIYAKNRI